MRYLIDERAQRAIADHIDAAASKVIAALPNHGGEEGLTPVLGQALMDQSFERDGVSVTFSYRQFSKQVEEPHCGADGGFVVRVTNREGTIEKAALFQAKLLRDDNPVRSLRMSQKDAKRLTEQTTKMLRETEEAVAVFYTARGIYVVDASDYAGRSSEASQEPLSQEHRLITLGTYLGRWMPRCTKGDQNEELIARVSHDRGFKQNISLDIVTKQTPITWPSDTKEESWQSARKRG